ncbi:MAG: hypothetical protein FJX11_17040 [Alphaproteobacteria bacterium]|nr:hypothetical protein [Alphaproteobacteria bacterium]
MTGAGARVASGERFAAVSGCPEATAAALAVLDRRGNVFDAALAASAVLCVALPHAVALGGDLFALVRRGSSGRVVAINATGAAPAEATIEAYRSRLLPRVPAIGPLSIQAPGLVAGWQAIADRFASLPLAALLEPAIAMADLGFPAGGRLARIAEELYADYSPIPGWREAFAPAGRPISAGERLRQPALAGTLREIAGRGAAGFYSGPVARDIAATVRRAGGLLSENDLEAVRAEEHETLSISYSGARIHTQPPISQGVVLLRAMRLLAQADGVDPSDDVRWWPIAARAIARAFAERLALLGDDSDARRRAEALLDGTCAADARDLAARQGGETTSLAVVNASGDAIGIIQSVFADFGSGVVGRESGVLLNNRLSAFFLDPGHPNALKPRRKTMHTLHGYLAEDARGFKFVGGSPGGDNQPQVNLQVLSRVLDRGEDPGEAVAAPRWSVFPGTNPADLEGARTATVKCEPGLDPALGEAFRAAGFALQRETAANIGSAKLVGRISDKLGAWADDRREGSVGAS